MATRSRRLEIEIAGDPKGALGALNAVEAGTGSLGSKFAGLGPIAAAGFAVVAAAGLGVAAGLFKIGSDFQDAANTIRVKTGETGDALEGLKKNFDNVFSKTPASMGDVSLAISTLHQKLGLAGPPLEDLSLQMIRLSRITKTDLAGNLDVATSALNNWNVPAERQSAVMDEMFRASQLSGASFETIASGAIESGTQLRALGFEMDDAIALTASLSKAGLSVGDVMPALSKAMATAAKEGKNAGTLFQETFDTIKNSPSDVSAAGEALKVFGAKAGPKLAELIREGKLSYTDMLKSIQGGSDTIAKAAADTSTWSSKLEVLKHKALLALKPIAEKVFQAVSNAIKAASPYVAEFAQWVGTKLPIAVAAVQPWIDRLGQALRTAGEFVATRVVPALVALGAWLIDNQYILEGFAVVVGVSLVAAFISWAVAAASAAAATLLAAAPAILVTAALTALAAGIIYAYQNFDWFRNVVDSVASFMVDTVWPALQTLFEGIVTGVQWVSDNWRTAWDAIQTAVGVAWAILEPIFNVYLASAILTVQGTIEAFGAAWDIQWSAIAAVISWVWEHVISPIAEKITGAVDKVSGAVGKIKDVIGGIGGAAGDVLGSIPGFASGGVVPGPTGAPMLAVVHGGEYVVSNEMMSNAASGGGSTVAGGGGLTIQQLVVNANDAAGGQAAGRAFIGEIEKFFASGGTFGAKTRSAIRSA